MPYILRKLDGSKYVKVNPARYGPDGWTKDPQKATRITGLENALRIGWGKDVEPVEADFVDDEDSGQEVAPRF